VGHVRFTGNIHDPKWAVYWVIGFYCIAGESALDTSVPPSRRAKKKEKVQGMYVNERDR